MGCAGRGVARHLTIRVDRVSVVERRMPEDVAAQIQFIMSQISEHKNRSRAILDGADHLFGGGGGVSGL